MVFKAFHLEIFYHQRNIEEVQGDMERKTEDKIQSMMNWIMCFSPQTVGNDQFCHGELRKTLSLLHKDMSWSNTKATDYLAQSTSL